ncbi:MAG: cysteine hydrolase family protein [Caulobacter sp.]|nr:cysteine hydrolase family protein [Caulobacter sp.]
MFDRATTVLIPIDMQQAFDGPPWPRRWNTAVDANGHALLAAWRAAGAPIIHVRHDSVQPGSTLAAGQPGNAFRPGFEPLDGEPVVSKSVNAAFIGTDLDLRLRRMGATRLVLFGISTDMCVSTSTRVGSNLGWAVTLAADACDCFDLPDPRGGIIRGEDVHAAHIATLGTEFCEVASTADIIDRLAARTAA